MTTTFCGNKDIVGKESIRAKLYDIIEELMLRGEKKFLLGGYGDFDILAAEVVKSLKEKYPHIESVIILPYPNKIYNEDLYDFSEYPELENIPPKLAILKRNEYMVNKSDVVVAYVKYTFGGSYKTLKYAIRKNKQVIDLTQM